MTVTGDRGLAVVVVDHDAGDLLAACLRSLADDPPEELVVVDNGSTIDPAPVVAAAAGAFGGRLRLLRTGANVGYGAGANRGVAATEADLVLVANPDLQLHPGALGTLAATVVADPGLALAGPRILEPDGRRYPSARRFPAPLDAAGHALLGRWRPGNRFSRRYRMDDLDLAGDHAVPVDWVSGACFVVRRQAWEELGGFDEAYFMYAEDMDLCWRAGRAGWGVAYQPGATVTHLQGMSTRRRPYAMVRAHHRSALRFAVRTSTGWRRPLLAPAAAVLAARLVVETLRLVIGAPKPGRGTSRPDRPPGQGRAAPSPQGPAAG